MDREGIDGLIKSMNGLIMDKKFRDHFKVISKDCPWRSFRRCKVLHSDGENISSGCKPENCAPLYLTNNLIKSD